MIGELLAAGLDVVAPANPLRGLVSDAGYLASVAEEIDGPVLLVGHSYGGAVITVAGALAANILGLAYVAGFAIDEGESALNVSSGFPETLLSAALRPATFPDTDGKPITELYIDREAFPKVFAADLPLLTATAAAASQRPIAAAALEEKSPSAAWKSLPSWYVVATADRIVHPDAQRFMAKRAGAHTVELEGSHAIARSQPALIAGQIRTAAGAVRRPTVTSNR